MGTWGTGLFCNDLTCDVRDDFLELLKKTQSCSEATKKIKKIYEDTIADVEEGHLFWFALADTQWEYGQLLPEVKDKALFYAAQKTDGQWMEARGNNKEWEKTVEQLKNKILSTPPKIKQVERCVLFKCKWQLGDVFAYELHSKYSLEKGYAGRHFAFRKTSEDTWYPGHIIPVIQFYYWHGETLPRIEDLKEARLLPSLRPKLAKRRKEIEYNVKLITERESDIPDAYINYLGNVKGNDLIPYQGRNYWTGYTAVGWETSKYNYKIEHHFIDLLDEWENCSFR